MRSTEPPTLSVLSVWAAPSVMVVWLTLCVESNGEVVVAEGDSAESLKEVEIVALSGLVTRFKRAEESY